MFIRYLAQRIKSCRSCMGAFRITCIILKNIDNLPLSVLEDLEKILFKKTLTYNGAYWMYIWHTVKERKERNKAI